MAPKLKRSTKGTPETAPRGQDALRGTPQRVTYQIPRADIFAASQARTWRYCWEEMIAATPALAEEEEPPVGEVLPEDASEDEDAPEPSGRWEKITATTPMGIFPSGDSANDLFP